MRTLVALGFSLSATAILLVGAGLDLSVGVLALLWVAWNAAMLVLYGLAEFFRKLWRTPPWCVLPIAAGWMLLLGLPPLLAEGAGVGNALLMVAGLFVVMCPFGLPFALFHHLRRRGAKPGS